MDYLEYKHVVEEYMSDKGGLKVLKEDNRFYEDVMNHMHSYVIRSGNYTGKNAIKGLNENKDHFQRLIIEIKTEK